MIRHGSPFSAFIAYQPGRSRREAFFSIGPNRVIGFDNGLRAVNIAGITLTAHPDRTWTLSVCLVLIEFAIGWVDIE